MRTRIGVYLSICLLIAICIEGCTSEYREPIIDLEQTDVPIFTPQTDVVTVLPFLTPTITSVSSTRPNEDITISTSTPLVANLYNCTNSVNPNSMNIAFVANWDGDNEIYTVRANGTELQQVTMNTVNDILPVWSPTGKRLAFLTNDPITGLFQLQVMGFDTSINNMWPIPSLQIYSKPKWSPDGQKIAVDAGNGTYIIDIPSGEFFDVNNGNYLSTSSLDWSSNGEELAFMASMDTTASRWRIYVAKTNGENAQMVQSGDFSNEQPIWNPKRNLLLFSGFPIPLNSMANQLYIFNLETEVREQITNSETIKSEAVWSPNGEMIAFLNTSGIINDYQQSIIQSRSIVIIVLDDMRQETIVAGDGVLSGPSWSLNNQYLAFVWSPMNQLTNLYVVNLCNNMVTRIIENVSPLYLPSWQP